MTSPSSDPPPAPFRGLVVPPSPTLSDARAVTSDYRAVVVEVMTAIADRYDRNPGYPYIDTKLDLITGCDFAPDDPLRGRGTVYGWIQGRGLEALAGHVGYLRPDLHLMAYQTRSAEGLPVPVIPATADADPGYHTGLSLIDALDAIGTVDPAGDDA